MLAPIAMMMLWISWFESTFASRAFSTLMILPRSGRIAWNSRLRASTAEPPAELPSTRYSSHCAGSVIEQSASLPGRRVESSAVLRRVRSRALRAACRARAASTTFVTIALRVVRVLLEELREHRVHRGLDDALDRRVAELGLRLALELRLAELDRDDRGEALDHVLAEQVLVLLLERARGARVGVHRARERGTEAREVRAALVRVDVVRERVHRLGVRRVPLHRDLDVALLARAREGDDVRVRRILRGVDVADEVGDAALVAEGLVPLAAALVDQLEAEARGQEGHLAHARRQHVELELAILEDVEVGHEDDGRAGLVGVRERAARDQLGRRIAARERLRVLDAVAVDREVEVLAERVHDRHADAVEPAGDLVALAAELSAGMQLGQHDGGRGQALVLHHVDGDPTAVVVRP